MDESFSVRLFNPTGGSELSGENTIQVNILSNDNAYGRIAFVDSSLNVSINENSIDSPFRLQLVRQFGTFGQIILSWNASTLGNAIPNDIYPPSGQVIFAAGSSTAYITMYVRSDALPELSEQFIVG